MSISILSAGGFPQVRALARSRKCKSTSRIKSIEKKRDALERQLLFYIYTHIARKLFMFKFQYIELIFFLSSFRKEKPCLHAAYDSPPGSGWIEGVGGRRHDGAIHPFFSLSLFSVYFKMRVCVLSLLKESEKTVFTSLCMRFQLRACKIAALRSYCSNDMYTPWLVKVRRLRMFTWWLIRYNVKRSPKISHYILFSFQA